MIFLILSCSFSLNTVSTSTNSNSLKSTFKNSDNHWGSISQNAKWKSNVSNLIPPKIGKLSKPSTWKWDSWITLFSSLTMVISRMSKEWILLGMSSNKSSWKLVILKKLLSNSMQELINSWNKSDKGIRPKEKLDSIKLEWMKLTLKIALKKNLRLKKTLTYKLTRLNLNKSMSIPKTSISQTQFIQNYTLSKNLDNTVSTTWKSTESRWNAESNIQILSNSDTSSVLLLRIPFVIKPEESFLTKTETMKSWPYLILNSSTITIQNTHKLMSLISVTTKFIKNSMARSLLFIFMQANGKLPLPVFLMDKLITVLEDSRLQLNFEKNSGESSTNWNSKFLCLKIKTKLSCLNLCQSIISLFVKGKQMNWYCMGPETLIHLRNTIIKFIKKSMDGPLANPRGLNWKIPWIQCRK